MSQAKIKVVFVGNRTLDCTNDGLESAPPAVIQPPSPASAAIQPQSPASAAASTSEEFRPPTTDDELEQLFRNAVRENLQEYGLPSDASGASYDEGPPSRKKRASLAVRRSDNAMMALLLHAILLDPSVRYKLTVRDDYSDQWALDSHIRSAITHARNDVYHIAKVWWNAGDRSQLSDIVDDGGPDPKRPRPRTRTTRAFSGPQAGNSPGLSPSSDPMLTPPKARTTRAGPSTVMPMTKSPSTPQSGGSPGSGPSSNKRKSTDIVTAEKGDRPNADKNAQRTVPKWYNSYCLATHKKLPDGAHIFPVGVRELGDVKDFWDTINNFWPSQKVSDWRKTVHEPKTEKRNIIPLSPEVHRRWDRHYFALRPIQHKSDPDHNLYVQFCWSKPIDKTTGDRDDTADDQYTDILSQEYVGGVCDWRRRMNHLDGTPHIRAVRSGDIYRITTSDPKAYPLPSYKLLEIQYALHRVLGSLKAAGWLDIIFRGPPPDVDPVPSDSPLVKQSLLTYLLEEAHERGILTTEEAGKWHGAIVLAEHEERQKWRDLVGAWSGEEEDSDG